jgi:hypothetical protein
VSLVNVAAGPAGRMVVRARVHDRKSPLLPFEFRSVTVEWTAADGVHRAPMQWYGEYLWRADLPATSPATTSVRVCATDAAGNTGCANSR